MSCKHKFQPRYNHKWSTLIKDIRELAGNRIQNVNCKNMDTAYLQEERYIYDICVKCGKIIKEVSGEA